MSSPAPERGRLEEIWRKRLKDAQLRVDFARRYLRELVQDMPLNEISDADGYFAYQQAIRAETLALREYRHLVRIYTDLTVKGIIPNESEWFRWRARGAPGNESE